MKQHPPSFLAGMLAVLYALTAVCGAADKAATPDYKALVNAMFEKAAVCKIGGYVLTDKVSDINYSTPDAKSLQKLKEMLLTAKMVYAVNQNALGVGQNYGSYLHLSWFDARGKNSTSWQSPKATH